MLNVICYYVQVKNFKFGFLLAKLGYISPDARMDVILKGFCVYADECVCVYFMAENVNISWQNSKFDFFTWPELNPVAQRCIFQCRGF